MSGDARGLQTRSEAPRGVFGRFNSYPFPPLIKFYPYTIVATHQISFL